jgi:hypothetical protein
MFYICNRLLLVRIKKAEDYLTKSNNLNASSTDVWGRRWFFVEN